VDPFTYPIHIRFGDTDALGHVNNAVYLSYFEAARLAYARFLLAGTSLERIPFILGQATVRFLRPVFFDDTIVSTAHITRIGTKSFTLEHELLRAGEVVTHCSSELVWFDYAADSSAAIPAEFLQRVLDVQGSL
jgi:acyl-CoA thioester hydrolase